MTLRLKMLGWLMPFCFAMGFSQSSKCVVVLDSLTLESVEFANVILYNKKDSTILQFGVTDIHGEYCLQYPVERKVNYYTLISHLSFRSRKVVRNINDQDTVFLAPQDLLLNEIIISNRRDVVSKKDTITFDVKEFLDSTESNLEDVLNKLPGITVDRETGDIIVLGRSLKTILLENENVTDKNYKIASKNLPAYAVQKIQIIKNYGEDDPFSSGRFTALNVKLTEDAKDRFIGNVNVGFGTKGSHNHNGSAIIVSDKIKSISSVSYNNIGKLALGANFMKTSFEVSGLELTTKQFSPVFGRFRNSSLNVNTLLPSNLLQSNNELLFTNNTVLKIGRKSSVNLVLVGQKDENSVSRKSIVNFPIDETTYSQNNLDNLTSTFLSSRIEYSLRLDSTTSIELSLTVAEDDRKKEVATVHSLIGSLSDQSDFYEKDRNMRLVVDKQLSSIFSVKLSSAISRKILVNDYRLKFQQPIDLPFANGVTKFNQFIRQKGRESVQQALIRAVTGKLKIITGINFRRRNFSIMGEANTIEPISSNRSNSQKAIFSTPALQFYIEHNNKPDKRISFTGQLFQTTIENDFTKYSYKPAANWQLNYYRRVNFLHNFNLTMEMNSKFEGIDGFYSDYYVKSPLLVYRGSNLIDMSRVFSTSASYSYENFEGDFLFSVSSDFNSGHSGWAKQYNISESGLVLEELMPGSTPFYSFNASANVEKYLEKSEFRIKLNPTYTNSVSEFRTEEKVVFNNLTSFGLDFTARSGAVGSFGFYTGISVKYNRLDIDGDQVDYPLTSRAFLDVSYSCQTLQTNITNDYFLIGNNLNTAFHSLGFKLKWKTTSMLSFTLEIRNLLDEGIYTEVNTGPYLVSSTNYAVLPRFGLIGVSVVY